MFSRGLFGSNNSSNQHQQPLQQAPQQQQAHNKNYYGSNNNSQTKHSSRQQQQGGMFDNMFSFSQQQAQEAVAQQQYRSQHSGTEARKPSRRVHTSKTQHSKQATQTPSSRMHSFETPSYGSQHESSTAGSTSAEDDYNGYLIDQRFHPDPCPEIAPRSKKMSLGSITYTAENALEFGVLQKDNSFYLRVEKCEPVFNDHLNAEVEKLYNVRLPTNVPDVHAYWPEAAFNTYCNNRNERMQREMDRIYRAWHDARCGMSELYQRVAQVAKARNSRYF